MEEKEPLIILTGPTAVGKTDLSLKLAKRVDGEIISADSMQVYRQMDIGSAKIKSRDMQGIPHHLIDIMEPEEDVYKRQVFNIVILEIYNRNVQMQTQITEQKLLQQKNRMETENYAQLERVTQNYRQVLHDINR